MPSEHSPFGIEPNQVPRTNGRQLAEAVHLCIGLEDATARIMHDALIAGRRFGLVTSFDEVLVPRLTELVVAVDGDGVRALPVVVNAMQECRRDAVGEVADVDVEARRALIEGADHGGHRRGVVRQLGHHIADFVLCALSGVEGSHHIEMELLDAVRKEQLREVRHRLQVRGDDAHVDGDVLSPRLQIFECTQDALERTALLRCVLVRFTGCALNGDSPGEVSAGGEDLIDDFRARSFDAIRKDDDLFKPKRYGFPHHGHELGLKGGFTTEESQLAVPVRVGLTQSFNDRRRRHGLRFAHRRALAAHAEHAAVVAHVAELNLDLLRRLHEGSLAGLLRFRASLRAVSYRDESDALRARITTLEAKLKEKKSVSAELQTAALAGRSLLAKRVFRHSLTLNGRVSKEGLDAIRQMLWARLGASDAGAGSADEPPIDALLTHERGKRIFRVVESAGKTHLSVDHHRRGSAQSLGAAVGVAVATALSMLVVGVHDDWIQMILAGYAIAALVLGPAAFFHGKDQESKSVALLKSVAELTEDHLVVGSDRVHVEGAEEGGDEAWFGEGGEDDSASSLRPRRATAPERS
ncbi:MAG: hypothetical protein ACI9KE_004218 [Polyangiales bacterium]